MVHKPAMIDGGALGTPAGTRATCMLEQRRPLDYRLVDCMGNDGRMRWERNGGLLNM